MSGETEDVVSCVDCGAPMRVSFMGRISPCSCHLTPDTRPAPVGELIERLRKWSDPAFDDRSFMIHAVRLREDLKLAHDALAASVLQPVLGEGVEEQGVTGASSGEDRALGSATPEPVPVPAHSGDDPSRVKFVASIISHELGMTARAEEACERAAANIIEALDNEALRALVTEAATASASAAEKRRGVRSGMKIWAAANNVNRSHLNEFMNGKRGPCADLLRALGLEYRIVRPEPKAFSASAIEARSGETRQGLDGAAAKARPDAQNLPQPTDFRDKEPKA